MGSVMEDRRLAKLGKFLALILRHQPERFALALDEQGWASLTEVLAILNGLPNFRWATLADVRNVAAADGEAGVHRFEVQGDRIRACYGHSFDRLIAYEPCTPPPVLYYGAPRPAIDSIRQRGLLPIGRQYVHLSTDPDTALRLGTPQSEVPLLVRVRAAEAYAAGITFYSAGETVYLARTIPAQFVALGDVSAPADARSAR
ncbi:MAG: RNA 2'-phosphotransferase [Anaerolineales bacterium]|nr:RNA 2'-phosphotransferase [Anaerolineales bacterium]